jgi:hypothetical protein
MLAACDGTTISVPLSESSRSLLQASRVAPVVLLVKPQLVEVELTDGGRRSAEVRGQMILATSDDAAAPDGAILVVSAADGPMPNLPRGAWAQVVFQFTSGMIDPSGAVTLAGVATLHYPDGTRVSDAVTASTTLPDGCKPLVDCPDDLIFDILGGQVYDDAGAPARFGLRVSRPL